ncbi:YhzD family protein [Marininema halotolerans]|uniref:YhzD-like protein n=1 Tax=Marininema halotolerans TaxID=1155944 RepID=A0A1I6PPA6_9BACL|nr:YhzD family protein [Marininema halotolerans]SFS41908.1 YhzD-like protein [Marininema halotolerans]
MYHVTAYSNEGKKLVDQPIEAQNDHEAKEKGFAILKEKEAEGFAYRILHDSGRLVDFTSQKGKSAKSQVTE